MSSYDYECGSVYGLLLIFVLVILLHAVFGGKSSADSSHNEGYKSEKVH